MVEYENECCGCATDSYPCMGDACSNRHVMHCYCDKCEDEFEPEELYITEDGMYCQECLLNNYDTLAQQIENGEFEE